MSISDEVRMTYSAVFTKEGKRTVRVVFERGKSDFAEGVLPEGKIESSKGFSDEELFSLNLYLAKNSKEIIEKAKEINPIRNMLYEK